MNTRRILLGPLCWAMLTAHALAAEAPDACDLAAAHPSDPDRVAPGVPTNEVVTHVAIPACRRAVEAHPDEARFHYQLGRALVYWAGANGVDTAEGVAHVERAADAGYTQALFVLGLLRARAGEACAAEPLYRQAANQGLKSARISYVDAFVSGAWRDCEVGAGAEDVAAYLDAARGQVSGYYEGLLLGALQRELASVTRVEP